MKKQRIVKLLTSFIVLSLFFSLSMNAQEQRVTMKVRNASLKDVFKRIEKQTTYRFSYRDALLDNRKDISMSKNDVSVSTVLDEALSGRDLDYKIVSSKLIAISEKKSMMPTNQTKQKVSGVIKDENGEPVIGASITVKGRNTGTVTDLNGNYSLEVSKSDVIDVSYIGYQKQSISIGNKNRINVTLKEDSKALDEVIVVGYGVQKKKLSSGATIQVKGEDIQKLSTMSPLVALQSQSPGLSIIATSSRPDSPFKINVRGQGTIGNSAPLVIINGIVGGDLNSLSPSDIESIDVLKDAASAAIYGSRAANGVILVTTKQGKVGKVAVSYDGYVGVQNVSKYLDMVNADQYMNLVNESLKNSGAPEIDFSKALPNDVWSKLQSGWQGTNWWKEITNNNALIQNHAINVVGGTEQSKYSLGLSHSYQEGILGNPNKETYKRYTLRLNSEYTLYKKGKEDVIKIGENILYTFKDKSNGLVGGWRIFAASPLLPVKDSDGNYSKSFNYDTGRVNPAGYQYYSGESSSNGHDLKANLYIEIQPIKDLKYRSNFGYSLGANTGRGYNPVYYLNTEYNRTIDNISQNSSVGYSIQWENTLSYSMKINKHDFSFLLGQSLEKSGFGQGISGSNMGSIFDSFEYAYLNNVKSISSTKTSLSGYPYTRWALSSFFGRINYDYNEKYLLTAILRKDGSSKFARGKRWGYFPSLSLGWVLSEESFMASSRSWLDLLKIRASWGQNGNQDISDYQYLAPYVFSGGNYYFGNSKSVYDIGAYTSRLANKDVTWETSEQMDFGFDTRFFNSRLGLTFDIYNKKTKDWLVAAPVLGSYGASAPYINGGDVSNKGVEFSLSWNDKIGDFVYGVSANLGLNKNKVTRIANTEGIIEGSQVNEYSVGQLSPYRAQVGYPIGYFWGYKTDGVFQNQQQIDNYKGAKVGQPQPGDLIFVDLNNDGTIDTKDRTMIGDPNPDGIYGFSLSAQYKGLDVSIIANGVFGNENMITYHMADGYKEHYPHYLLGRWHGEGTSNKYPRLTSTPNPNYTYFSDIYLSKGDYLRIQNISVGYDFKKLFDFLPMSQVRLYFTVQNLYTFTKYIGANPEVGAAPSDWAKGIDTYFNPIPRTFMFGANIKF